MTRLFHQYTSHYITFLSIHVCCKISMAQRLDRGLPNYSTGVDCIQKPTYGEYCDRYGSGTVKKCSACSVENLVDPNIDRPEECADYFCPYRCPEGLDSTANPAPASSCDLTTRTATTTNPITYPSTEGETLTVSNKTVETYRPVTSLQTTNASPLQGHSSVQVYTIVSCTLVGALVIILVCMLLAYICVRLKNSARISSNGPQPLPSCRSGDPLIDGVELSQTTGSETPPTFNVEKGPGWLSIQADDSSIHVKLGCACGQEAIPTDCNGAKFGNLLKNTEYEVIVGNVNDDGVFNAMLTQIACTRGRRDYEACSMSLYDYKKSPKEIASLSTSFSRVSSRQTLREVCKVISPPNLEGGRRISGEMCTMAVENLVRTRGQERWDQILQMDNEWRPEPEESLKVYELLDALWESADKEDGPQQHIVNIITTLSSLHSDCTPCLHLLHQASRVSVQPQGVAIQMV